MDSRQRGGLGVRSANTFYWYQIVDLDSVDVKIQKNNVAWRLPNFCNVASQRNNLKQIKHYDDTKKRAHDSHIVRAKKMKVSHGGPSH